jgi:hypothetical protein
MTEERAIDVDSGVDETTDESTEELVASIDATRDDMTETVEAIGERLDPARIVQDAKETVREATVGKVETMTDYVSEVAGDAGATIQATGGGLVETIRRNPIPAAMAAVGIGWLVTHRADGGSRSRDTWYGASSGAGSMHEPGSQGWQGGQDWTRGQSSNGGLTDQVGRTAGEIGDQVGQTAGDIGSQVRSTGMNLMDTVEREPLAAGAVAVAVGAAIGLLVPATRLEQQVIGPTGQRVLDTVEEAATSKLSTVQDQQSTAMSGSADLAGQGM